MLDPSILVAAVRSDRGASRQLLAGALERRYEVLVSVPLMIEYEAVLTRAEHLDAAGFSAHDMTVILDALGALASPVRLAYLWRPLLADPNDDMVLETAVNGNADLLVTLDRTGFGAASTFRVKVVSPADTVDVLRRVK